MQKEDLQKTKNNNIAFLQVLKSYLESNPILKQNNKTDELEIRFGTNPKLSKPLSKIDYTNVVKFLYSCGFKTQNEEGLQILRIQNQFTDKKTGKTKMSNIRAEIIGSDLIQEYCKTNSIQKVLDIPSTTFQKLKFTQKIPAKDKNDERIEKVDMDDFNFRVSYQVEQDFHVHTPIARTIISSWEDSLKTFRCLNRVRFYHEDYPIFVDLSILKTSKKSNRIYVPTYTIQEAEVFQNVETYEIELEVDNSRVGLSSQYEKPEQLMKVIKKCIRIILSGLQKTKFPISYLESNNILQEYLTLIHGDDHNIKRILSKHFLGPSSLTLQLENISTETENSIVSNIRNNYTVTDKADGDRYLLFIDKIGKIYLIDTNMNVLFTGTFTKEKSIYNSLIDGEFITTNKNGKPIQLYAAFDVYYVNNKNFMNFPFDLVLDEEDENKNDNFYRLSILNQFIEVIKPRSILDFEKKSEVDPKQKTPTDFRIKIKTFHNSSNVSIFSGCSKILSDVDDDVYEYETDGLIFTPSNLSVGASSEGEKVDIKYKTTWAHSMKWKPAEFNTIDFLVTIKKDKTGKDDIHYIYQDGENNQNVNNVIQYKTLILRCGFDERKDGYINPSQNLYNDDLPSPDNIEDQDTYKPVPFYPTNPSDDQAHLCNIYLKDNGQQLFMTTENGEYFEENTIVEFRYDKKNKKGWNWVPIRVRYDKTSDLRNTGRNFGNSFKTANSNWYSIHNPITLEMIKTGTNIPTNNDEEVYYNRNNDNETNTQSLRDFHNLYVKSKLIQQVSSQNDILIDYSVGKGGDLSKWIKSKLKFVFGVDISKDNIYNRVDGACSRYLNMKKKYYKMPAALFVSGDSGQNIRDGSCFHTDKEKQIANCVFGNGPKDELLLGKGVYKQYGVAESGFNISSCQFSIHYFFKDAKTLHEFLRNLTECTKVGGYFIATGYDGNKVFNLLKNKKNGEPYVIMKNNKKIFEITKRYDESSLPENELSLGYDIDVYQESINKTFKEYLVQFDFFKRIMENYGFVILPKEEANSMQIPDGTGLFETLFNEMEKELQQNPKLKTNIKSSLQMTPEEKQISFLNRYYIFKKIRNVDAKKIESVMTVHEEEDDPEFPGTPEGTPPAIQIARAKKEKEEKTNKNVPKATNRKITLN